MMCSHRHGTLVRTEENTARHVWARCKTWDCTDCRDNYCVPRWTKHLATVVPDSGLFRRHVAEDDWQRLYYRLFRAHADFIKIRTDDGFIVWSTVQVEWGDHYDQRESVSVLTNDVSVLSRGDAKGRAITTSKPWTLHEDKPPSKSKRLTSDNVHPDDFKRAVKEIGGEVFKENDFGDRSVIEAVVDWAREGEFLNKLRRFTRQRKRDSIGLYTERELRKRSKRTAWDSYLEALKAP